MRLLGRLEHDECAPWCNHDPAAHHPFCFDSFCGGIGDPGYRRLDNEGPLYKPGDGDCFWLADYGRKILLRAHYYLMYRYNVDHNYADLDAARLVYKYLGLF